MTGKTLCKQSNRNRSIGTTAEGYDVNKHIYSTAVSESMDITANEFVKNIFSCKATTHGTSPSIV